VPGSSVLGPERERKSEFPNAAGTAANNAAYNEELICNPIEEITA